MTMHMQLAQREHYVLPERTRKEAVIQRWLITRVAALTEGCDDIDITQPFSAYALDSVGTVGLTGELQDWLGIKLAPTLIWDYPSIELLARHLATRSEA
jgi:acyl carrier protein